SRSAAHVRLLGEILRLAPSGAGDYYYGYAQQTVYLESITSRRIWDVLAEARELGLPLVLAGPRGRAVALAAEPARLSLQVARTGSDLDLEPRIEVAGAPVELGASVLLGEPAHGIAWWQVQGEPEAAPKDRVLRLAPLAGVIDTE